MTDIDKAINILDKEWRKSVRNYREQNPQKLDREDALYLAVQTLREKNERKNQSDGWIETEFRSPDAIGQHVWIYPIGLRVVLAEYEGEGWYRFSGIPIHGMDFAYWKLASVPQPPEEETL